MRGSTPLRKLVMAMRSNTVAWNPLEAFVFTAANEDSNLYTYDIRRFNQPINVHMDHVSAVLDVDYSPTGQEFVTGSFDKTIRIFERDSGRSRWVCLIARARKKLFFLSCDFDANRFDLLLQGSVPHSSNAARVLRAVQRWFNIRSLWKRWNKYQVNWRRS